MDKNNKHKLFVLLTIICGILTLIATIICFTVSFDYLWLLLLPCFLFIFFGIMAFTVYPLEKQNNYESERKNDEVLNFCEAYKPEIENLKYSQFIKNLNRKTIACKSNSAYITFNEFEICIPAEYVSENIKYKSLTGVNVTRYGKNEYRLYIHYRGIEIYGKDYDKYKKTSTAIFVDFDHSHVEQVKEFYCLIKNIVALREYTREAPKRLFYSNMEQKGESVYVDFDDDIKRFLKDKNYKIIKCTCSQKEETQENLSMAEVFDIVYLENDYEKNKLIVLNRFLDEIGRFSKSNIKNIETPEWQIEELECYIYSLDFDDNDNYVCSIVIIFS